MSPLELAIERLQFARAYTSSFLEDLKPDDWFRQPTEGVTHVAWQVGHIAMAEHWITLVATRDERPEDEQLISEDFRALFGRGSTPDPNQAKYPAIDEIRAVYDRVHRKATEEAAQLPQDQWDATPLREHPAFATKLSALVFGSEHEIMHGGQIGLLRRLLGYDPLR